MRDEEAFLRAIAETPDDDAPRLVYADWLEDHGRPDRARFIRLHVAWCRRDPDAPPDEELSRQLVAAWKAAGLHDTTVPEETSRVYDRGFVAGVRLAVRGPSREQVEEVFDHAPVRVAFFRQAGDVNADWLSESPLLARLTGFCCADSPGGVGRLLGSPHLAGLDLIHVEVGGPEEAVEAARSIA